MTSPLISLFHGKSIFLSELLLRREDGRLEMLWKFSCDGRNCSMAFQNVSRVNMQEVSFPMQISDLALTDNTEKGWSPDSRYYFHDSEEHSLSFYCESYTLTEM